MPSVLRLRSVTNTTLGGFAGAGVTLRLASGTPGPNQIVDTTALGTLTSAATDAAFVLAANSAGTFARQVPLGSVGRSLLGATTLAGGLTLSGGSLSALALLPTDGSRPVEGTLQVGSEEVGYKQIQFWNNETTSYSYTLGPIDETGVRLTGSFTAEGPITATEFAGSGASLTGIPLSGLAQSGATDGQYARWDAGSGTWVPATVSSGVNSVFGRSGAVTAATGDYTAAQVTNAVSTVAANSFLPGVGVIPVTVRANASDSGIVTHFRGLSFDGSAGYLIGMNNNFQFRITAPGKEIAINADSAGQTALYGETLVSILARQGEPVGARLSAGFLSGGSRLWRFHTNYSAATIASQSPSPALVTADVPDPNLIPFYAYGRSTASYPMLVCALNSSTGAERSVGDLQAGWADSIDASRAGRLTLRAYSTTTAQEGLRIEGNAGGVRLGFYGGAAAAKPTVTGSRGGNAALASLLTALASFGLLTDSTTV